MVGCVTPIAQLLLLNFTNETQGASVSRLGRCLVFPVCPGWSGRLGVMRQFLQGTPPGAFFSLEDLPIGFCFAMGGSEPILTIFFSGKTAFKCWFEKECTKVLSTQIPG